MSTWLLVEDEPDLYDLLCALIESIDHRVLGFTDGEEAVAWIKQVEAGDYKDSLPELALLDVRLPGKINGPDVAAQLRKSKTLCHTVIVLMTAYRLSVKEEAEIVEYAIPDMMLQKPLPRFTELRRRLEELLM